MVRGELVDEAGGSAAEWIGLIRVARHAQEQTLEAIADLPGGQVPASLTGRPVTLAVDGAFFTFLRVVLALPSRGLMCSLFSPRFSTGRCEISSLGRS